MTRPFITAGRPDMQVKYKGHDYLIPEIWMVGFCSKAPPWEPVSAPRATIDAAVAWWHYQAELGRMEEEAS